MEINIEEVVRFAAAAPSGDNCQPLTFRWNGRELEIFHNQKLAEHFFNPGNLASMITLGATLELIKMAASHQGYLAKYELADFSTDEGRRWAAVKFSPETGIQPEPLLTYAFDRKCGRFRYIREPVNQELLASVEKDFAAADQFRFHSLTEYPESFIKYLCESDKLVWDHPQGVQNTFSWIRFRRSVYEQKRDGIFVDDLGVKIHEIPMIKGFQLWPSLPHYLLPLGVKYLFADVVKRNVRSAPACFLVSTSRSDFSAYVDGGRWSLRMWLNATRFGYVMQPLSAASLLLFGRRMGHSPPGLTDKEGVLLEKGDQLLSEVFKCPKGFRPFWMFRAGRMSVPHQPTLRRTVEQLLVRG